MLSAVIARDDAQRAVDRRRGGEGVRGARAEGPLHAALHSGHRVQAHLCRCLNLCHRDVLDTPTVLRDD
ncbi:hypothetical protein RR46_05663 [Papilio xuthus]|uniref:Uncharacterized protein n=1 Tax=Papilio xuthus TaxID=66420 RepID=A0A194PUG2_PAPXU|nr:hypothetical protein RR46_05663 [Papilio xuthus]